MPVFSRLAISETINPRGWPKPPGQLAIDELTGHRSFLFPLFGRPGFKSRERVKKRNPKFTAS
jgi:hypothetical protein